MNKIIVIILMSLNLLACSFFKSTSEENIDNIFQWESLYYLHKNPAKPIALKNGKLFYPHILPINFWGNWEYFHHSKTSCEIIDDSDGSYTLVIRPHVIHFYLYEYGGLGYISHIQSINDYQIQGTIALLLNDFTEVDLKTPMWYENFKIQLNSKDKNQLELMMYDNETAKYKTVKFHRCPITWETFKYRYL